MLDILQPGTNCSWCLCGVHRWGRIINTWFLLADASSQQRIVFNPLLFQALPLNFFCRISLAFWALYCMFETLKLVVGAHKLFFCKSLLFILRRNWFIHKTKKKKKIRGKYGLVQVILYIHLGVGHSFCAKREGWAICFLTTTFSNAPAHPTLYFLTSPLPR